jgi:recombination protein RecA
VSGLDEIFKGFQKDLGATVGQFGSKMHPAEHLPTDIFAFDMAMGGGWVKGRMHEIYGPESAGKTNLILKSIASAQRLEPHKRAVLLDLEHSLDAVWAKMLGVDVDRLLVMRPDFADQAIDMVEAFVAGDDVSIVAVDSIAAMVTANEANREAALAAVGGSSAVIGKMIRKTTLRLNQQDKVGNSPTVLFVNQIRHKIGQMMGNPETTPGGNAPRFAYNSRVRCYGQNIKVGSASKTMSVIKQNDFIIKKWKSDIISETGMYQMVTKAHDGFVPGDIDDANTVLNYMKKCGVLTGSTKDGWKVFDEPFKKQEEIKTKLYNDKLWSSAMKTGLIKTMMAGGEVLAESNPTTENDV